MNAHHYAEIAEDPRQSNCAVLRERTTGSRLCKNWAMGFKRSDSPEAANDDEAVRALVGAIEDVDIQAQFRGFLATN
ncbi:BLUF domain-containing protein [Sphingomicrobium arenosum]|uniref:hypothetical protein n=1 Tax=Sphingomicrobium arenosum TaxID=2233861 RepID=UPI002240FF49|nr:hypothetical protein [Sphingomicrobium arenosum]